MFKKFLKELIEAQTMGDVLEIFYSSDGIDMAYQRDKLSWKDYQHF